MNSSYWWRGKIVRSSEVLLIMKTKIKLFGEARRGDQEEPFIRGTGDNSSPDNSRKRGLPWLDRRICFRSLDAGSSILESL